MGVPIAPFETNAELIVDPDAVLPFSVALSRLQPKSREFKVSKRCGRVQQF